MFINIYRSMTFSFKKWLIEAATAPTAPSGGGGSSGGGLFGTGTPFKYTPSNSNKNAFAKTPDQWYKRDISNKFDKGCSGLNCPKSITG